MFIRESGKHDAPAIVFLHGNGANGAMWKTHMEQLGDYHCLAPDFPGFGKSNNQEWESISETTEQVIEIIRSRTQNSRAHVVGLSLGGSVTIKLLSKAPEVIDHAIVDGSGVVPLPGLPLMKIGFSLLRPFLHTDFVIKTIARSMKIPDSDYNGFKQGMMEMSPSSFTRSFLQASAMRLPAGLGETECPTLFVSGEKEPNTVKQSNIMLARLLPNARSRMVPGMGHGWLAEAVDLHIRMVRAWINDQPLPQELAQVRVR